MSCTWIVVADSSRARIFAMQTRAEPLLEISCLSHVESRIHDLDDVGEHHLKPGRDQHASEMAVFARQIAGFLEQGRVKRDYNNLILVSPPAFLGALRHAINEQVMDYISSELDKNLLTETEASIRKHLF